MWWWPAKVKAFTMPSSSMEPTMRPVSYLMAQKRSPADIRRGDIIAFRKGKEVWFKRVVGLPGDRIALVGGRVRLNGRFVKYGKAATYTFAPRYPGASPQTGMMRLERLPGEESDHKIVDIGSTRYDEVPETVVEAERFYVLGDNRDDSTDSRMPLNTPVGLDAHGGLGTVAFDDTYGVVEPKYVTWIYGANDPAHPQPQGPVTTIPSTIVSIPSQK